MATEEKWREIGSLSKSVRSDIQKLISLSNYAKLRKKEKDHLHRCLREIDRYRAAAENRMFTKDGIEKFDVFYGGDEK